MSTEISKMYSIKQDKNIKGEEINFCIECLLNGNKKCSQWGLVL